MKPLVSAVFALIALCLCPLHAQGQNRLPLSLRKAVPTQYVQTHWGKEDGLPQGSISALAQTRSGHLWAGTQEGLARFDGHRFRVYTTAQYPSLPSDDITALLEDASGTLWIGTTGGLARFDGTTITAIPALDGSHVRALYELASVLWVGTEEGVVRLQGGRAQRFGTAEGLPDGRVLSLAADARGRLFAGTYAGLARLDGPRFSLVADLPATEVFALYLAPDGRFLVGTQEGVLRLKNDGVTALTATPDDCPTPRAFVADADGRIWVGTEGHGLCMIKGEAVYHLPPSELPDAVVRALTLDTEGGIWAGFYSKGLLRLHQGAFTTLGASEGLSSSSALTVLETRDGTLWVGSDGGGLDRIKNGHVTTFGKAHGLVSPYVLSLLETRDGTLWAAPMHGGLCRFNGSRFSCLTTRDGLLSNNVLALYESADGTLWIGTDNGLNTLRAGRVESMAAMHEALTGEFINALEGTGGAVWAGTATSGVMRVTRGNATQYGPEQGLPGTAVLALHRDDTGTLWVGYDTGGGLCRLVAGATRFRCYASTDGLFDDDVLQILSDGQGFLWLGSNKGFVRMPLEDFDRYDAQRLPRLTYDAVGVTPQSGLRDTEAMGGLQPTSWRGRDGTLYVATTGGVGVVHPDDLALHRSTRPPPVYVEAVRLDGVPVTGDAPLPPHPRDLRFDFSAVAFQNPDSVRIRFRLDGFDDDWHDLEGRERSYTYANLSGGTYTFRVQAAAPDGAWSEEGAAYTFEVRDHPTETWWFYLLCGLGILGTGVALSRARVQVLKKKQRHLEQVVAERTAELRAHEAELQRVNEGLEREVQRQFALHVEERHRYEAELIAARDHAEASARLKSAILDNMSHEFRTPVSAILGSTEILRLELQGDLLEFVNHIDTGGRRLMSTLNNVLDLSRIEGNDLALFATHFDAAAMLERVCAPFAADAAQRSVAVRLIAETPLFVEMDASALETICANLVSNAVKFTDAGHVEVALTRQDACLHLVVRDTGIGIGEAFLPEMFEPFKQESGGLTRTHEGAGLGLAIVQGYVAAVGGTLEVESRPGAGTTVSVEIPLEAGGDGALCESGVSAAAR